MSAQTIDAPHGVCQVPCRAVLLDLDGVLVDSARQIRAVIEDWASRHGLDPGPVARAAVGRADVDLVEMVAPHLDAHAEARAIARVEELTANTVTAVPGAPELIGALGGLRWAVVTSSALGVARGRLRAAGLPAPSTLVSVDDVVSPKPHPEPYLRAAAALATPPDACVVIEDSSAGVAAACAAGMRVIGLTADQSLADALFRVTSLSRVRPRPVGLELDLSTDLSDGEGPPPRHRAPRGARPVPAAAGPVRRRR